MIALKLPWPPAPPVVRALGAGAAAVALVGALALATGASALVILGGALTLGSLVVAALSLRRAAVLRRHGNKLSNDLDALSLRLIVLEGRMARGTTTPRAEPSRAGEEVTAEIGLLGEIVRDLAVAVAAHDREVTALKQEREKAETGPSEGKPTVRPAAASTPASLPRPTLVVAAAPSAPTLAADPAKASAKVAPLVWPPRPSADPLKPKAESEAAGLQRSAAVLAAFDGDRLELHLQPIVNLPQRRVRLYEALARLRLADETLLVPAEFLPVLERQGRMPDLDRKVLARSAAIARHLESRGSDALICCNLAPQSLEEPGFLRAVGRLVEAHPDLAARLVLELSQRSWRTLDAEKAGALATLRDRGLGFSLDGASDLRLDPLSLADRGVRFVKLPGAMLLGPETARSVDVAMSDLSATLARAGIRLVAERIEREEDIPDLIDLDVPLAQGFAFGRPRAVRPEVVTGAAVPVAEPQPAPTPARPAPEEKKPEPAPPQRLPFRAFLRRAS